MNKPLGMLLAGGGGTRLGVLVSNRSKPAVPFGGRYRIIDFALSNVMHAQLDWVGVLTQYKPLSLMSHIGTGDSWNFRGRGRGVRILPPRTGKQDSDWYRGTADAIWQSMDFMEPFSPKQVLVLSGDHVYCMDYKKMWQEHVDRKADLSVAVLQVEKKDSRRFGMLWADQQDNIIRFEEKPAECDTRLASLGIYLFEWPCLVEALYEIVAKKQGVDFGKDIIPALLGTKRIMVHRFKGYWRDVGTTASFYDTNMDLLRENSELELSKWEICTSEDDGQGKGDRPPVFFGSKATCQHSIVSAGCRIEGHVSHSILSPGVVIGENAVVEDSIIMHHVCISPGAMVRKSILDKDVVVGAGAVINAGDNRIPNSAYNACELDGKTVVGKGVRIPEGIKIGSNVVIEAHVGEADFPVNVEDGQVVTQTCTSAR